MAGSFGFAVTSPVFGAVTIGVSGFGAFAVAFAGVDSSLFPFVVTAVTSVLSFTLSAGIVISPVFASIWTSGLPVTVHVPFPPLIPSAVFFEPSSPV